MDWQQLCLEVEEAEEEAFDLYTTVRSEWTTRGLGAIDGKKNEIEISDGLRDYVFQQNPSLFRTSRSSTGYVVWQISVYFAQWLLTTGNPLRHVFEGNVFELGSGVGVLASVLGPKARTYVATDQKHVLKLLSRNIDANTAQLALHSILAFEYDWCDAEIDTARLHRQFPNGFDTFLAFDCVYNEELIPPFVQACVRLSALNKPAIFVIGQELRSHEVMALFLQSMLEHFVLYRVKQELLGSALAKGFCMHIAICKELP